MKTRKTHHRSLLLFCTSLFAVSIAFAVAACGVVKDDDDKDDPKGEAEYYLSLASESWQVYDSKESIPERLHFQTDGDDEYKLTIQLDEGEQFTVNKLDSDEKIGYSNVFTTASDLTSGENGSIKVAHSGTFVLVYNETEETLSYSYSAPAAVPVSGVTLDQKELTLELNEQTTLTATVEPQNAENKIVSYSSSDDSVVTVTSQGVVTAVGYGTAVVTVTTAQNGKTDTCNVTVVKHVASMRFSSEELTLIAGGNPKELSLVFSPSDATFRDVDIEVTSGESFISIEDTSEGYEISGLAEGTATIKATLKEDHDFTATCTVTVLKAGTVLASIENNVRVMINGSVTLNATVENGTIDSVNWSIANETVATISGEGSEATVTGVDFGSTVVTAKITVGGTTYTSTCDVLVADEWYFIYGYGLGKTDWDYADYVADKDAAQLDELFLTEQSRGIYTLTRHFTPSNGFQIIFPKVASFTQHDDSTDDDVWSKNIPSHWVNSSYYYDASKSDRAYIKNSTEYFCVNAAGIYTVTLDLTGTSAKVGIKMVSLDVTDVQLALTNGNYVLSNGDTATVSFSVSPTNADYTEEGVRFFFTSDYADHAKYLTCTLNFAEHTLQLTASSAPQSFTATLHLTVNGVEQVLEFSVLSSSDNKVAVSEISFEEEKYEFNVNNGAGNWTTTVKALVNADATNQQVRYYDVTDYSELLSHPSDERAIVDPVSGEITARSLGTLKIKAVSLDNPDITATVEVLFYSDQIYLIGASYGGWTALGQGYTSTDGTGSAQYTFTEVSHSKYTYTFTPKLSGDSGKIKIVFLGIDDAWTGEINYSNIVTALSDANFGWESGNDVAAGDQNNIVFMLRAQFTLTIDLSMHGPVLLIDRSGKDVAEDYTVQWNGGTQLKAGDTVTARLFKIPLESIASGELEVTYDGNDNYMSYTYDEATNTLTFTVQKQEHKEDKKVTVSIKVGDTTNTQTFTIVAEHHLELTWDNDNHWYYCTDNGCDYIEDDEGNAGKKSEHDQQSSWSSNAEGHYYACSGCGAKFGLVPHVYDCPDGVFDFSEDLQKCKICKHDLFEINGNTLVYYYGKEESVQVPDSVTILGAHAFEGHQELKTITYSTSLTTIGDYCFAGCTNLKTVRIGNYVTKIGQYAFKGTTVQPTWGKALRLTSINSYSFAGWLGTTFEIPSAIETVASNSFNDAINLKKIVIPETVKNFNFTNVFDGCTSLTFLDIAAPKVEQVGGFEGCTALETVIIRSVKFWEFYADSFKDCDALQAVYLARPLNELLTCKWLFMNGDSNTGSSNRWLKGKVFAYSESNPGPDPCGDESATLFGYFRDWFGGYWHWDESGEQGLKNIQLWDTEESVAIPTSMPAILNDDKRGYPQA